MYVISVIPIARGITHDFLSYLSPVAISPGSIISVPLRKKNVFAIVISSVAAREARGEIRSAGFEYKKLESVSPRKILPPPLIEILPKIADYFAASQGSVIASLAPKFILSANEKFDEQPEYKNHSTVQKEILALQEDEDDRFSHYKSAIRERFARKESVLLLVPTLEDAERIAIFMKKGIEDRTIIAAGKKSVKDLATLWNKVRHATDPILIIATTNFLILPRADISLIIVERESSRSYKNANRPFIDSRFVVEKYASAIGANVLLGDIVLRPETIERISRGEVVEYAPLSMRSLSTATDTLIDMTQKEDKEYSIISSELENLIRRNKEQSGLAFVFAGRKGLAGNTVCQDCGTAISCDRCSAALTLYGKGDSRFFICNKCGKRFSADMVCPVCQSWRLLPLGIGTERVEETLKEKIEGLKVFRLDSSSLMTPARSRKIIEEWLKSPGSVLVGTESAIPYIYRPIDIVAVASLDSIFALPDFRVEERVFSIILSLRARAGKNILIQTRFPHRKVIEYALKGNIAEYMKDERKSRHALNFPPFSTFIKVSYTGKRPLAEAAISEVKKLVEPYEVMMFPALVATVKNQYIMHALISLPAGLWPESHLLAILRSLSPAYAVNVNPESIL